MTAAGSAYVPRAQGMSERQGWSKPQNVGAVKPVIPAVGCGYRAAVKARYQNTCSRTVS
jgi:hypothetical protein